jgi:hypothetical protein
VVVADSIFDGWVAWLTGFVTIATLITAVAALANKTPFRQLLAGIGWVFVRLVGQPMTHWVRTMLHEEVRPIIRQELDPVLDDRERLIGALHTWQADVDIKLDNLQREQVPHIPTKPGASP